MARSQGDPRVLLVINFVLSAVLVGFVLWGFDFLGVSPFSWVRFAIGTLLLMALTHVVTR